MDSSFSPSSCAVIRELFCILAVGLGQGVMMLLHDQSRNSTHGGLSYQIIEGMWFSQKHGANLPPKVAKGNLIEKLPSYGDSPPPHLTSHHISPHLIAPHHIAPNLTASLTTSHHNITSPPHISPHHISMIAPQIKWGSRPTQPSAKPTNIIYTESAQRIQQTCAIIGYTCCRGSSKENQSTREE